MVYISVFYEPLEGEGVIHVIECYGGMQARVSFSGIVAETLVAATSADRGSLIAHRLKSIYNAYEELELIFTVDSQHLYSTIKILREGAG